MVPVRTRTLAAFLATLALSTAAAHAAGAQDENPTTPGAIPNPGSYQGSMELQRREHEQSQPYQQPSQPNYYAPQRSQGGYGGGASGGGYGGQRGGGGGDKADLRAFQRGDYATAYRLTMPLALRGDRIAQYNIGLLYGKGLGVRQDFAQAAVWYQRSAAQGWAQAANDLGLAYALGKGVPRDFVQSYLWLTRAATWSTSARDRAQVLNNRRQVAEAMSPAQRAQAQRLAGGPATGSAHRRR